MANRVTRFEMPTIRRRFDSGVDDGETERFEWHSNRRTVSTGVAGLNGWFVGMLGPICRGDDRLAVVTLAVDLEHVPPSRLDLMRAQKLEPADAAPDSAIAARTDSLEMRLASGLSSTIWNPSARSAGDTVRSPPEKSLGPGIGRSECCLP